MGKFFFLERFGKFIVNNSDPFQASFPGPSPLEHLNRAMDTFTESSLISQRVGEFTKELPTAEEIDLFYSLEKIKIPEDRPYGWSNTICTLDGVVSIGQGYQGVKLVGLKNFPQAKARTDFRLLAAGSFL